MKPRLFTWIGVVAVSLAVALLIVSPLAVFAQTKPGMKPKSRGGGEFAGRQVTLKGRIVCVHTYMVEGTEVTTEKIKAVADAIRIGAPAALETNTGLVLLGQGTTNAGRFIFPHALRYVEVKGRMHDKGGLKYLDFAELKQAPQPGEEDEDEEAVDEGEEEEGE